MTLHLHYNQASCLVCSKVHTIKKKNHGKPSTCFDCQCKELNKDTTPMYEGNMLGSCSRCGAVVEVQEGFLVPHHPTRTKMEICAGSAKLCRSYEKFRDFARFQEFKFDKERKNWQR